MTLPEGAVLQSTHGPAESSGGGQWGEGILEKEADQTLLNFFLKVPKLSQFPEDGINSPLSQHGLGRGERWN